MSLTSARGWDRGREEVFQLKQATWGGHIFIAGHTAHRRFVHLDSIGDLLKIERTQMRDAMGEERILLTNDLAGDLQNRAGALVQ